MEVDIPTDVNPKKRNSVDSLCNGTTVNGNGEDNDSIEMNDVDHGMYWHCSNYIINYNSKITKSFQKFQRSNKDIFF